MKLSAIMTKFKFLNEHKIIELDVKINKKCSV